MNSQRQPNVNGEGLSYSKIQKQLGISRPAIHRALKAAAGTKSRDYSYRQALTGYGGGL
jgi:hypothetical protein